MPAAPLSVDDVTGFGVVIVVTCVAGLFAVWSNRVSERIRIPAPAMFLVAVLCVLAGQLAGNRRKRSKRS